jgi:hypothetical protein
VSVSGTELVCPGCGARVDARDGRPRFCPDCHLPLVFGDAPESGVLDDVSERRRRARQIKPQLAEGPLVKVAWVRNQTEGEFLQGLLLEQGVPSLLKRTAGFDVPDMLAAGPRDVMVAASGVEVARETLLEAGQISGDAPPPARVRPGRLLIGLVLALAFGVLFIWLISLGVH